MHIIMYNIHRDTILSYTRILFSKSFTNISYFTPDVNSNFKKITFLKPSTNYPTRLYAYTRI